MKLRKNYNWLKQRRNSWVNLSPGEFIDESLSYNDYIDYKFYSEHSFLGKYNYYQNCLYESLSFSYDPDILIAKLYQDENIRVINYLKDEDGIIPDTILVYTYDNSSDENIEKLCNFFGYYITRVNNEHTFYTIESRYGITDVTDVIYEDFSEILYHITNKKNINKIFKLGLYCKAKNKKVIHPERIYFTTTSDYQLLNELAEDLYTDNDYIILKIDLNENNFKCKFFLDPAYSKYGCFTYENISPKCISIYK